MFGVNKGPVKPEPFWTIDAGDYVNALAWSPDSQYLAAAAASGEVVVARTESGVITGRYPGHAMGALCLAWSADGELLASGGQDGFLRVWNNASGQQAWAMKTAGAWVEHLDWNHRSDVIAAASGKHLQFWKSSGELQQALPPNNSTIAAIQWQPGGNAIAFAGYKRAVLWRLGQEKPEKEYPWGSSMISLRWSPNGKWIACGCQDAAVHVWNARTGEDMEMSGYPTKLRELSWDRESRYLATGGGVESIVWDFSGKGPVGSRPRTLSGHQDLLTDLAFQPTGDLLATGGRDGMVIWWNPRKNAQPAALAGGSGVVTRVAWNPGGQLLAASHDDGRVLLYKTPV
ncbi:MAG: hypothetical protein GMKNLPBB_02599 [Myxococcota bacterium]|nr:hypothetical protein [Myxococcota bacterium]